MMKIVFPFILPIMLRCCVFTFSCQLGRPDLIIEEQVAQSHPQAGRQVFLCMAKKEALSLHFRRLSQPEKPAEKPAGKSQIFRLTHLASRGIMLQMNKGVHEKSSIPAGRGFFHGRLS